MLLLDRRDKQFRLTVPGTRFFTYAERLLALQREAKSEMGSARPRAVSLRIGAIESVLHSWLIEWVQHMRRSGPEFELELTVETTPILLEQLKRGTLDIAFAALPAAGDGLRSQALPPMAMVFAGHRELHRKRLYTLADLAELELLTFQRGSQPHVALVDLFRNTGWGPHRVHNISSISAMLRLVERGFGIGCSFSFEQALIDEGLPLRHVQQGTNVPMFRTGIETLPAGPFRGPMVVTMRPLRAAAAIRAIQITSRFPDVHGAPVHLGDPALIGIKDIARPDYGDAVEVLPDELPVFWACGVTPQAAIEQARPEFCITHAPGAMLVTDLLNHQLASF